MVEIGPGLGALTEHLVDAVRRLDVVELDRDLVPRLEERFGDRAHFHIHSADALKFNFAALAEQNEKLRVVGNLPYNISTPLLFHLLEQHQVISDMHFMLQSSFVLHELPRRFCAGLHQNGHGAEPLSQPHQDLRHVREADVLPGL